MQMFFLEGATIEALINVPGFVGVVGLSIIWVKFLSRHIPADQLFLKVWRIPLWLGIAAAVLGVVSVSGQLGHGEMEDLGHGVAVAIVAIIYGVILGPLIFFRLDWRGRLPRVIIVSLSIVCGIKLRSNSIAQLGN